ncbi:hypothetical protein BASA60_011175 [Batrachochytrium salamandrivorans]|nr:hypothetical protein BASA60_011175 [Batrachochytrium salamandrivorans]
MPWSDAMTLAIKIDNRIQGTRPPEQDAVWGLEPHPLSQRSSNLRFPCSAKGTPINPGKNPTIQQTSTKHKHHLQHLTPTSSRVPKQTSSLILPPAAEHPLTWTKFGVTWVVVGPLSSGLNDKQPNESRLG